ncbi:MAG: YdiU family protein [Desulfobulbus sp.]|nr:YdiU family protein [Desulfobulbus sp.]
MTRALAPQISSSTLNTLVFDNRFTQELPADPRTENAPRQVYQACYSRVQPTPVKAPLLVAYSKEVADLIDLGGEAVGGDDFVSVFSGNRLLAAMDPHAACYGGHQFGNWAGQLGDGRAINLGEVVNRRGDHWMLQLKGAGPTPYSRSADGLAVLRSSLREFLCSEAMYHLGIPTTRALSLILTGESVMRDMFYDGHPALEPGAVVCRLAPSFLRFGNFEILAARGELDTLKQLVQFTLRHHFPHLGPLSRESMLLWFEQICRRTAELMVHWLRVGFVHGVMNTDNMSILGLTIDYGPYGWLEDYDPTWTPNTTDAQGRRYCYGRQAQIGHWNLAKLAGAISPLIGETKPLEEILAAYSRFVEQNWQAMMADKLGLRAFVAATDQGLVEELLRLLPMVETDMTLFFRRLAQVPLVVDQDQDRIMPLLTAFYQPQQLTDEYRKKLSVWLAAYARRLCLEPQSNHERVERMNKANPKYVLRNYLAQLAIDKVNEGDYSLVKELLEVLRHPYEDQPDKDHFAHKRPEWARNRPGCSMLSCSS